MQRTQISIAQASIAQASIAKISKAQSRTERSSRRCLGIGGDASLNSVPRARNWGGARRGAGRPRSNPRKVAHAPRPLHEARHPLHVTLRVVRGCPNLRAKKSFGAIKQALAHANATSALREHFRLTHYSVQTNHLHFIVEADDREALMRGMQGLEVSMAKRLNAALGRTGRVFVDRYYARALRTPREVRTALAYVLLNERHHVAQRGMRLGPWYFDACSSALEFDGWRPIVGLDPPPAPRPEIMRPARSALLTRLWRRWGLIEPHEVPGKHDSKEHLRKGI